MMKKELFKGLEYEAPYASEAGSLYTGVICTSVLNEEFADEEYYSIDN